MDGQQEIGQPDQSSIKTKSILKTKKFLVVLGSIVVFALLLFLILLFKKQPTPDTSSTGVEQFLQSENQLTWKLTLSYNLSKNELSFENIELLNKKINQDFRSAKNSPFQLLVLDTTNRTLYETHIVISALFTDFPSSISANVQPNTILYIPYQEKGEKIWILRNDKLVLEVTLPKSPNTKKNQSVNFSPQKAYAQDISDCRPIQIVFVNDGYPDTTQFHNDVKKIEDAFKSIEPFDKANLDIKSVENPDPAPDCLTLDKATTCLQTSKIRDGASDYPDASVYIALTYVSPGQIPPAGGYTNAVGGNTAVVYKYNSGLLPEQTVGSAIHEVLGHAIGGLNERYVMSSPLSESMEQGFRLFWPHSNCSENQDGEDFWKDARSPSGQNAFAGCAGSPNLYAPGPLTCSGSSGAIANGSSVVNEGTPESIMSSPPCSKDQFDTVEKYWIEHNVLPNYSCSSKPKPTSTPKSSPSPMPSPTPVPIKQYSCEYEQNCSGSKNTIQICSLHCTSK